MSMKRHEKKLIFLLRHGDIGQCKEKRYISQSDNPLSALGVKQASLLKEFFSRVPLGSIYCSDLDRSRQTAGIIAAAHPIHPIALEELREINMGDWEGKTFSEISAKYPKAFQERGENIAGYSPPRGESFSDCGRRVIPAFERLSESAERPILIVGHAGVNRVILCYVLGIPLDNLFRLEQSYGCINLICKEGSQYRLKSFNDNINSDLYKMD
ncbi:alpha-ribazole phosphatase [Desulfosporosinus orientis DSM 765]|uniref:Alpha-ribazole phosphatase n=1 Tax=Desulfosporosinus orientis (strain ATCC 19365 / DSM 765 / NCIMB 8382 / VKM B-1628 / Singapore I) TaxID=768706 RepID=G7WEQ3_DESOD|nr:alpha-ribazole phosphatase [Desulfosporosinus orientis]AET66944.1 alpha-ribazole phosphatase [Desulfosporosinus orientis DSM 765]